MCLLEILLRYPVCIVRDYIILYLLYFNFAVGLPLKLKLDSLANVTPAQVPSYIKVFEKYFRFISQRRLALSEPEPECHGTVVPQYVG